MRCAVFVFLVISSVHGAKPEWPCGGHSALRRNVKGDVVWYSSSALKRRATHKVATKVPFAGCAEATIIVDVLIDTEGSVLCTRTIKGHPLLRRAAEENARQWKFKPLTVGGKAVAAMGRLALRFSWKN